MKVAYFVNQYPKVSHSFIRREILALERQGVEVVRIALRGWKDPMVDEEDRAEQQRTHHVLRRGWPGLATALMKQAFRNPRTFLTALRTAMKLARGSDRPMPYHLAYLAEACAVLALVRENLVTHLHAHFGTNSAEVAMLVRVLGGPPYSFTVHGPEEFDRPEALHLKEKIEGAAFVVAISSYARSQLFRWVGHEYWSRIRVVHCGLEERFHAGAEAAPPPDLPRLVCVGRLCEQKGQLLLLEAARLLKETGTPFELVLAGDGEMRSEIEELLHQYGLVEQVRITGWISSQQVRQELEMSRALVLPSFAEGLPVVIMEAMALGRPVLSSTVAGIPELVRNGIDGWLVPPGDVQALADAMHVALNCDSRQLQTMGQAGRQRVLARHAVDQEATKLLRLFEGAA